MASKRKPETQSHAGGNGITQPGTSWDGSAPRRITIRDVARQAGVAISSVSRVLSNHPHVSDQLRVRVEMAARELGYRPNHVAHSLRRGNTLSAGFLVGTISNPIIADISASASDVLASNGYATLLVCSENDPSADVDYLHFLAQRRVSGLIVSSAADGPDDRLRALLDELGLPAVMLDRRRLPVPHVSAVVSDHQQGVQAAVAHLLAQGHRRIALVGGQEHFDPAAARLSGYLRGFETAGLAPDLTLVRSLGMGRGAGYTAAQQLFGPDRQGPPPTALIAGGNLLLAGVLQALKELRITVGRDIALVGCDDTDLTRLHSPPITVIARDLAQMGRVAAQALLDLIDHQTGKTLVLPTQLEVRESSLCAPKVL